MTTETVEGQCFWCHRVTQVIMTASRDGAKYGECVGCRLVQEVLGR